MSVLGWFLISLPFGVAVYFAVLGVEHAAHFFLEARESETQAARLAAQLADARMSALRMQLQPHFLYNTLNAITVVARDRDSATAVRMLEQLADMLHRVLRSEGPTLVPLDEELAFVRQYLAIEEARFPDRLRPEFTIDSLVGQALVPEFVLQPLVENAIRHGLARSTSATMVHITARKEGHDLVLTVEDDGPGVAPSGGPTQGVGLANTRARLTTLYGDQATLELGPAEGRGTICTVRLPYRESAGG